MVTPLDDDGKIDFQGTENLVEHLVRGKVQAIFILGTTGEAQSLSREQREDFIEFTGKKIGGRLPYMVCVTDTSMDDACRLAGKAEEAGACAIVAAPPYYFLPSQKDIILWYTTLADRSPLPLFLYNMPARVKVMIEPETVRILASHPKIYGLKDSSANMTYFQTVKYMTEDIEGFSLYVGPEELTGECVLLGADGGVNGGANMFPELYVKMYEAARDRDIDTVTRLQKHIMKISTAVYAVDDGPGNYLQGLKYALEALGICKGGLALPYIPFGEECKKRIRTALSSIDPAEWV